MNKIIYQSKNIWTNPFTLVMLILTLIQIVVVVIILCIVAENFFLQVLIISLAFYLLYQVLKKESIFRIYDDRIDFLNTVFQEKIIKSIAFSNIVQVRYEDNFSQDSVFVSMGNFAKIYLYLDEKSEYYKSSKNGKIILNLVQSKNRERLIIDILKVFQNKKIEIFISTNYQKLPKELGLKNWVAP